MSRGVDLKTGQVGTLESCDQICSSEVITQTEQAKTEEGEHGLSGELEGP